MKTKGVIEEDFVNYKEPCMFINTCTCDFKCCKEANIPISICQNSSLAQEPDYEIPNEVIYEHFVNNPISHGIVIGGMEPILQFQEILNLIDYFRSHDCNAPFIIYTGYYPEEIKEQIQQLKQYKNIIIKFGRYVPNSTPKDDKVLGIKLVSNNQWGEQIS